MPSPKKIHHTTSFKRASFRNADQSPKAMLPQRHRTLQAAGGVSSVTGALSASPTSRHMTGADDDDDEVIDDPYVTAGFTLIQHGRLKSQLLETLDVSEAKATALLSQLKLIRQNQDEKMKSSATQRKFLFSLREEIKLETQRYERLQHLRRHRLHPSVAALKQTVALLSQTQNHLEAQLHDAAAQLVEVKSRREKLTERLRVVRETAENADAPYRVRGAQRRPTRAETDHRGDQERWLSLLRGETEELRREKVAARARQRQQGNSSKFVLDLTKRPDYEKPGAMGTAAEMKELLDVRAVQSETDRVERHFRLQMKRMEVALEVYAPKMLEKRRELECRGRASPIGPPPDTGFPGGTIEPPKEPSHADDGGGGEVSSSVTGVGIEGAADGEVAVDLTAATSL